MFQAEMPGMGVDSERARLNGSHRPLLTTTPCQEVVVAGESIHQGLCECGCGRKTRLAPKTRAETGWIRGRPIRFIRGHQIRLRPYSPPARPLAERFWEKVRRGGEDECWEWLGARRYLGYGAFSVRHARAGLAHRMAWRLTFGAIPRGLCVLHKCDNPPCVNPAHLFLGTMRDNTADMMAKGRARFFGRS